MGHRDTAMIIRVYGKYIENFNGTQDGNNPNDFYKGNTKRNEQSRVKENYGKIMVKTHQNAKKA